MDPPPWDIGQAIGHRAGPQDVGQGQPIGPGPGPQKRAGPMAHGVGPVLWPCHCLVPFPYGLSCVPWPCPMEASLRSRTCCPWVRVCLFTRVTSQLVASWLCASCFGGPQKSPARRCTTDYRSEGDRGARRPRSPDAIDVLHGWVAGCCFSGGLYRQRQRLAREQDWRNVQ